MIKPSLIKNLEFVVQFSVYFFLYQKGWSFGSHYLSLAGGAITFSLIYGAGCWVDDKLKTNMNGICTGIWLYYKGMRSLRTNREEVLASIIVNPSTLNECEPKCMQAAQRGWLSSFSRSRNL
jgi:hypothetical protein